MDVGRYEWLLEPNRRLHELLGERGYDVTYHEYNAGHNYPAWRDDLWREVWRWRLAPVSSRRRASSSRR